MEAALLGFVLMFRVGILQILVEELALTKRPRALKRVPTTRFRAKGPKP